jgi:ABC-2 type transport system ATP-binding protein
MQHAERLCDRFLIIAKGRKRFEGTLAEARSAFPRRLSLRARGSVDAIARAPGVVSITPHGEAVEGFQDYDIELARGADPQAVLRGAFASGLELSRFEDARASLHDIFVSLAGETEEKAA